MALRIGGGGTILGPMKRLLRAAALALLAAAPAAGGGRCVKDADCAAAGAGFQCVSREIACAEDPAESTCVERVCQRPVGGGLPLADRACEEDSDCEVVALDFQCMYCARPGDWADGLVAAANKKSAAKYRPKPTKKQLAQCAMAGPCATTGTEVAKCMGRLCVARYAPRGD